MPPRKTTAQVADCLLQLLCAEIVRSVIAKVQHDATGGGSAAAAPSLVAVGASAALGAARTARAGGEGGGGTFADVYEAKIATEAAYQKLESIGFSIGYRIAERMTKDRARLATTLDAIKFLCKDFWAEVFQKQVDKLQTNHRGVYVLQDRAFRWLTRMSSADTDKPNDAALQHLVLPCGLVRGALDNLGLACEVTANISPALPKTTFTIKLQVGS